MQKKRIDKLDKLKFKQYDARTQAKDYLNQYGHIIKLMPFNITDYVLFRACRFDTELGTNSPIGNAQEQIYHQVIEK